MKTTSHLVAALLPLASANAQYGNGGSSSSSTSAAAATATTAAGGPSKVQSVQVGKNGFVFTPDTITAGEGDVIEFVIQPGHSVARSSFDNPCAPISGAGIYSGAISSMETFSVTVNSTDPIWLYCGTPSHCEGGMAAVINQPSGANSLAAYKSAAQSVGSTTTPSSIQGGQFGAVLASGSPSSTGSPTAAASTAAATGNGASDLTAISFLAAGVLLGGAALML